LIHVKFTCTSPPPSNRPTHAYTHIPIQQLYTSADKPFGRLQPLHIQLTDTRNASLMLKLGNKVNRDVVRKRIHLSLSALFCDFLNMHRIIASALNSLVGQFGFLKILASIRLFGIHHNHCHLIAFLYRWLLHWRLRPYEPASRLNHIIRNRSFINVKSPTGPICLLTSLSCTGRRRIHMPAYFSLSTASTLTVVS
jgi:hypothetical protein